MLKFHVLSMPAKLNHGGQCPLSPVIESRGYKRLITTLIICLFAPIVVAAQSISLSVGNVPSLAANVIVVVDGGAIPSIQPVVAASGSGGSGQIAMNLGVPAGGPYRVRAIAVTGGGAVLRSGQAGSISVPSGGSTQANITLQDVTATFESVTPSSATAGSTVPIRLLITDPGDSLSPPSSAGLNASFTPFTVNGSGTVSGNNTTTPLGAQQYRISITATLPTTGGTWYYQVSTQAMQFVIPGTVPTFFYPNVEAGQPLRTLAIPGTLPETPVPPSLLLVGTGMLTIIFWFRLWQRRNRSLRV
jgi:hypothetical protein